MTLVRVHGLFSDLAVWDDLTLRLQEDEDLRAVNVLGCGYWSPRWAPRITGRAPDPRDLADGLRTYYLTEVLLLDDDVIFVTPSQVGLIFQIRSLELGEGKGLAHIKQAVLYACPNFGPRFVLGARNRMLRRRSPQEIGTRPDDEYFTSTQRRVLSGIVAATEVTESTCPVPINLYYGSSDAIVPRTTGIGFLPRIAGRRPARRSHHHRPPDQRRIPPYVILRHYLRPLVTKRARSNATRSPRYGFPQHLGRLFGRDPDLSWLEGDIDVPASQALRGAVIAGPPGVEKSTLLLLGRTSADPELLESVRRKLDEEAPPQADEGY